MLNGKETTGNHGRTGGVAIIIILILGVLVVMVTTTAIWQWRFTRTPHQHRFLSGDIPDPLPDGAYRGTADIKTSWRGKTFDRQTQTGKDRFLLNNQMVEKHPFATSIAPGLTNRQKDVFHLSYDLPKNHPFLRRVVEEIVEDEPNHLIGKTILVLPPGIPLTLGFFELERE